MTNVQQNVSSSSGPQKILAKDIHAKWDKISEFEAGNMLSTADLASQVQSKYNLSAEQAKKDVDGWTNGRSF